MNLKIKIYLTISMSLFMQFAMGQQKNSEDFKPADMVSDTLKNGLQYYIMHNENPQDRVAFYFAQNVGSILEGDDQQGLAHFLEHMAFNGTKHYPDKQMLEYLEKNGIKFGTEINAFTDYEETVYSIRNVPVKNERLLDSVLLILSDWSGGLTLSNKEIDNERGVVREEWRSRYNPQKRASDSVKNLALLKGSKYAKRSPIGTMDVIDNFKYESLKNYYEKWYRPDLQAVIIVGDIDVKKMEKQVKLLFSNISLRENLAKRPSFHVPIEEEFNYLTVIDRELGTPTVEYYIKHKADTTLSEKEEIEKSLKYGVITSIFNQRLIQLSHLPTSPSLSTRFNIENVVKPLDVLKITIQPKTDSILAATEFAIKELKRLMLYGTTPEELERYKSNMKVSLQGAINNNKGNSGVFNAIQIYEAFFKHHQLPDYNWQKRYELLCLEALKNQDLLDYLSEYNTTKGNTVAIIGTNNAEYPTKKEVLSVVRKARNSSPSIYKEIKFEKNLVDLQLPGGKVFSKKVLDKMKATSYTLSNGATVSLFSAPNKNEDLYFKAMSPGGKSLIDEDLLSNTLFASMLISESGIANLNRMELSKSGEVIPVQIQFEEYEETLSGYANIEGMEKLFKGIYLAFESPRFDEGIVDISKQNLANMLSILKGNAKSDLSDSLRLATSNYSSREIFFNQALLNNISMKSVESIYKERINNASDFHFVFMGDVEEDEFLALVEKYIGSIPGNGKKESFINHHMKPNLGIKKVHLSRTMKTPQASVNIYMTGDLKYTQENRLIISIVEQLLSKRYMERIREEEGGTYGVKVKTDLQHIPEDNYSINVSFNCNPDKTLKLVEIVYEEFEQLSREIDSTELREIKNNLKKEVYDKKIYNKHYFESKVLPAIGTELAISSPDEDIKKIDSISEKEIKKIVLMINKNSRIVEGVLFPNENHSK